MNIEGKITWVGPFIKSKKQNGRYFRIISFRILEDEEEQARVYLDPSLRNYKNWESLLVEGNVLGGLMWKDKNRGLIDADSPIFLL